MDDMVKEVIKNELRKGYAMNKKGLLQLKNVIVQTTNSHKFLSLINLRKWVNAIRKEMKAEEKVKKSKDNKNETKKKVIVAKSRLKVKRLTELEKQQNVTEEQKNLPAETEKSKFSNPSEVFVFSSENSLQSDSVVRTTGTLAQRMTQVQIQNMLFEINSIRQTLANISKKLDTIQAMLEKKD
ncbi:MAG: hypothetical protein QXF76_02150 [Candidatus Anstonellales archaeon]